MSADAVSELLFYHLENQPLETVLPMLLEKTLERDWRAVVECENEEILTALDANLWTFRDDSFLPHSRAGAEKSELNPIVLCHDHHNKNDANVRFFVGGARPRDEKDYERLVYLFDGQSPASVENARTDWRELKDAFAVTYWQQSNSGRWEKKA